MSTADLLLANLERLLSSPTSAGTIRKLIFDLAIRGQLTTQSDKDEPASVLIARVIRTAQDEDRKFSAEPVVTEKPFEVPSGWEWVRLGNTGKIFNGTSASAGEKIRLSKTTDGLPFIATKDVGYGRDPLCYENGLKVPHGDKDYKVAKTGAVLICAEGGSAGKKVGQTDRPICFGNKLYANETWDGIEPRYILSLYQSNFFYGEFKGKMAGIIGGIARSDFRGLRIPLPPIAEQKRIVAKVDELMALCDRLEAQLKERDVKQAALAKAALAKFTEDPTQENLQLLFHPSFSIEPDGLKNCIRSLAIQGKLTSSKTGEKRLGWQSSNLGALAAFLNGDRSKNYPSKNTRVASGVPFINAGHLSHGDVATDEMDYITEEHFNRLGGGKVQKGDVLYCLRGSLGKCAVVSSIDRGAIASSLVILRPGRLLDPHFLYLYLCSPEGNKLISKFDNGSAQPNLSAANVKKYTIHLPPIDEQQRIIRRTDELISLVNQLEDQLEASRTTGEKLLEAMVAELTAA